MINVIVFVYLYLCTYLALHRSQFLKWKISNKLKRTIKKMSVGRTIWYWVSRAYTPASTNNVYACLTFNNYPNYSDILSRSTKALKKSKIWWKATKRHPFKCLAKIMEILYKHFFSWRVVFVYSVFWMIFDEPKYEIDIWMRKLHIAHDIRKLQVWCALKKMKKKNSFM